MYPRYPGANIARERAQRILALGSQPVGITGQGSVQRGDLLSSIRSEGAIRPIPYTSLWKAPGDTAPDEVPPGSE